MRTANIDRLHEDFEERLDELLVWERKIPEMAGCAPERKAWVRWRMCESVLVLAFGHWERAIENLFSVYLAEDLSQFGKSVGLDLANLKNVRLELAQALIAGERYFDFKSFGEVRGKAKKLLVAHPFEHVGDHDRIAIDTMQALRNHILHHSRKSQHALRLRHLRVEDVGQHLAEDVDTGGTQLHIFLEHLRSASQAMRP